LKGNYFLEDLIQKIKSLIKREKNKNEDEF